MIRGIMYVVAILGWMPGFVANRFVSLLRQHGYSLADAFRLASQVSEGAQVAIQSACRRARRDNGA
jgi:aspartate-semialdehyde dehydrogenase